MYNWYGTREENARGNSLANNVSGLLTENYAFRSSERKGGGEESFRSRATDTLLVASPFRPRNIESMERFERRGEVLL